MAAERMRKYPQQLRVKLAGDIVDELQARDANEISAFLDGIALSILTRGWDYEPSSFEKAEEENAPAKPERLFYFRVSNEAALVIKGMGNDFLRALLRLHLGKRDYGTLLLADVCPQTRLQGVEGFQNLLEGSVRQACTSGEKTDAAGVPTSVSAVNYPAWAAPLLPESSVPLIKQTFLNARTAVEAIAVGDSMVDADIRDGDLVVFQRGVHFEDGDIVLARLNGIYVCKLLRIRKGLVEFHSANAARNYPPVCPNISDDCVIIGILQTVVRSRMSFSDIWRRNDEIHPQKPDSGFWG